MRALTPLLLALCTLVWLCSLWRGQPWPIQLHLGLPGLARQVPVLQSEAREVVSPSVAFTLAARAGSSQVTHALPCAPSRLAVQVTRPFGSKRGLEGLLVGWPGREDGYGVLAADGASLTLDLTGRGLAPDPTLTLTSLGGLFDGTGTLEVTPVCAD